MTVADSTGIPIVSLVRESGYTVFGDARGCMMAVSDGDFDAGYRDRETGEVARIDARRKHTVIVPGSYSRQINRETMVDRGLEILKIDDWEFWLTSSFDSEQKLWVVWGARAWPRTK